MSKKQPIKNHNILNGENDHLTPSGIIEQFNHVQYWGYGLVIFTYTVAEYAQEWKSLKYFMSPSLEPNKMIYIFRSILFIELVILIGHWFLATMIELDMWYSSKLNWIHWSNSFIGISV